MAKSAVIKGVDNKVLEQKREVMGYSYSLIAQRIGFSTATVSKLLQGKVDWRTDKLNLILPVLRLSIEDVVEDQVIIDHYKQELIIESEWHASQTNIAMEA